MLSNPESDLVVAPLSLGVAQTIQEIPRDNIPDMPDRIIAATAMYLNLPLITRDHRIRSSAIQTIW